jgi:DNA recombination protein Rad52
MFTPDQKEMLAAPLIREHVKTRSQSGRSLSYIEAWHAIAEANRIFGFDGWSRETIELKCVSERQREIGAQKVPGWGVSYTARVRIRVGEIVREGCGTGHGIDRDCGLAHESALKEAESDAMKRALMTFGNSFGLALYDKEQSNVVSEIQAKRENPHVTRPEDLSDARPRYDENGKRIDWIDTSEHRVERLTVEKARPVAEVWLKAMRMNTTPEELVSWGEENAETLASFPEKWQAAYQNEYQTLLDELRARKAA